MTRLTLEDVTDPNDKYWELMDSVSTHINSKFKLKHFVANHLTPGRAYHQLVMQLDTMVHALVANKEQREIFELRKRMNRRES